MFTRATFRLKKMDSSRFFSTKAFTVLWEPNFKKKEKVPSEKVPSEKVSSMDVFSILVGDQLTKIMGEKLPTYQKSEGLTEYDSLLMLLATPKPSKKETEGIINLTRPKPPEETKRIITSPDETHYIAESLPYIKAYLIYKQPKIAKLAKDVVKTLQNLNNGIRNDHDNMKKQMEFTLTGHKHKIKKLLGNEIDLSAGIKFEYKYPAFEFIATLMQKIEQDFGKTLELEPPSKEEIKALSAIVRKKPEESILLSDKFNAILLYESEQTYEKSPNFQREAIF